MMSDQQAEWNTVLEDLAEAIFGPKLRPASRWGLSVAAMARNTDGISGRICIEIPRKVDDPLDITFATTQ